MTNSALTSAQVAAQFRISHDALLLYEAEGIVYPLQIGDERYYSVRDRLRIAIILKGEKLGFSLKEIKSLIMAHLPEPCEHRGKVQLQQRIDQLESEKREIQAAIDRLSAKTEKP